MANPLGELFSRIAVSIRGGLGEEIGMIKPSTFPDRIDEIVDLIGSGSTGGGLLPAGVYWRTLDIKAPSKYPQRWVTFQGTVYAFCNTTDTGYMREIYKLVDNAWVKVVTLDSELGFTSRANALAMTEYHGKLHIYGSENKKHYVFDGTNLTKLNDVANKLANSSMFVQNDLLKAYSCGDGKVYVWDENTDAWAVEATVGENIVSTLYEYFYIVTIDDVAHFFRSDNRKFIYQNGVATQVSTGKSPSLNYLVCMAAGKAWNANGGKLTRFDALTDENEVVAEIPTFYGSGQSLWIHEGKVRMILGCYGGYTVKVSELCEVVDETA